MKRFSLTLLSISAIALFSITLFISNSESYAEILSVDKARGEWTLVVIPDTQSYCEEWKGQVFSTLK